MEPSKKEFIKIEDREIISLNSDPNKIILSDKELKAVETLSTIEEFKKGDIILAEGAIPDRSFHIRKGCIRQFYIVDGEEKSTFFYLEEQSISPVLEINNKPSKYYLSCVEDCTLTITTIQNQKEFYRLFPRFQNMCRQTAESDVLEYQEMLAIYITTSPEERYEHLVKTRPELLDRVPQHQLASYIGVKPESLSRIRKRIMLNHRKK